MKKDRKFTDSEILDWLEENPCVHISPFRSCSPSGWSVHNPSIGRLYDGSTVREALTAAMGNINPVIPHYLLPDGFDSAITAERAEREGIKISKKG